MVPINLIRTYQQSIDNAAALEDGTLYFAKDTGRVFLDFHDTRVELGTIVPGSGLSKLGNVISANVVDAVDGNGQSVVDNQGIAHVGSGSGASTNIYSASLSYDNSEAQKKLVATLYVPNNYDQYSNPLIVAVAGSNFTTSAIHVVRIISPQEHEEDLTYDYDYDPHFYSNTQFEFSAGDFVLLYPYSNTNCALIGVGSRNTGSGNGNIVVSSTAPTGDASTLWIDTSDGGTAKYWNGTGWIKVGAKAVWE